jgi:hypothetical protein
VAWDFHRACLDSRVVTPSGRTLPGHERTGVVALERPILGLTNAEAAEILGMKEVSVARLVLGKIPKSVRYQRNGLDRDVVERLSVARYKPGHPYWVTGREAASILGLSPARVLQLRQEDRLPVVVHKGRHYYRRPQLEVIANAREARLLHT